MKERIVSDTWPPSASLTPPKLYCKCMNLDGRCPNDHWTPPSEAIYEIADQIERDRHDDSVRPITVAGPRTFDLMRYHDVSGVSGEGIVAQGVQFSDGSVALRWPGDNPSTAVWESVESMLAVHGHNGLTVVRFHDGED